MPLPLPLPLTLPLTLALTLTRRGEPMGPGGGDAARGPDGRRVIAHMSAQMLAPQKRKRVHFSLLRGCDGGLTPITLAYVSAGVYPLGEKFVLAAG